MREKQRNVLKAAVYSSSTKDILKASPSAPRANFRRVPAPGNDRIHPVPSRHGELGVVVHGACRKCASLRGTDGEAKKETEKDVRAQRKRQEAKQGRRRPPPHKHISGIGRRRATRRATSTNTRANAINASAEHESLLARSFTRAVPLRTLLRGDRTIICARLATTTLRCIGRERYLLKMK